jgi:hypothetical protein
MATTTSMSADGVRLIDVCDYCCEPFTEENHPVALEILERTGETSGTCVVVNPHPMVGELLMCDMVVHKDCLLRTGKRVGNAGIGAG